jgi:hypothetical protein
MRSPWRMQSAGTCCRSTRRVYSRSSASSRHTPQRCGQEAASNAPIKLASNLLVRGENAPQRPATPRNAPQRPATPRNAPQRPATPRNAPQRPATPRTCGLTDAPPRRTLPTPTCLTSTPIIVPLPSAPDRKEEEEEEEEEGEEEEEVGNRKRDLAAGGAENQR